MLFYSLFVHIPMMHRCRWHDVMLRIMMLRHFVPKLCDVCPKCGEAVIIDKANIICRKANIIQKSHLCLGRQK